MTSPFDMVCMLYTVRQVNLDMHLVLQWVKNMLSQVFNSIFKTAFLFEALNLPRFLENKRNMFSKILHPSNLTYGTKKWPFFKSHHFVHRLSFRPIILGTLIVFRTFHFLDRDKRFLTSKMGVSSSRYINRAKMQKIPWRIHMGMVFTYIFNHFHGWLYPWVFMPWITDPSWDTTFPHQILDASGGSGLKTDRFWSFTASLSTYLGTESLFKTNPPVSWWPGSHLFPGQWVIFGEFLLSEMPTKFAGFGFC